MDRRDFLDLLAKGTSLGLLLKLSPLGMLEFVQAQSSATSFPKALLVDKAGNPLKLSTLKPHEPFVFAYPFAATPNILVNVDAELSPVDVKMPDGKNYRWPGGVGKGKSIVAYTSICPTPTATPPPTWGPWATTSPKETAGPEWSAAHTFRLST